MRRRAGLGLVAATMVAASAWMSCSHGWLPAPTGAYPVGTDRFAVVDAAGRTLVVQVWYPAAVVGGSRAWYWRWREVPLRHFLELVVRTHAHFGVPAAAGEAFPVLLYGARWGGSRVGNTALVEDLASHGYAVVAVDHPGNAARMEMPDGRVIKGREDMNGPRGEEAKAEERVTFWNQTLATWVRDQSLVLDGLATGAEGPVLAGRLDLACVGAFGHSFGGAAALSMLGNDARVRAGLNLDGWSLGGLERRTTEPVMIVYEEAVAADRRRLAAGPEAIRNADEGVEFADMKAVQGSLERFGGWRVFVRGAQHGDFSDEPLLPRLWPSRFLGPIAPTEIERLDRELVRAFFDQALLGRGTGLLETPARLQQAFPEVRADSFRPGSGEITPTRSCRAVSR